jgi:hypothetical protein
MRNFTICTAHQILFGSPNQEEQDGQCIGMSGGKQGLRQAFDVKILMAFKCRTLKVKPHADAWQENKGGHSLIMHSVFYTESSTN